MTAEMLLAQRHLQVEQQWRRQRCDDLLALLLGGSSDSPRLLDEAQQLGLKPQLPRVPCLFELEPGPSAETLSGWLMSRFPDSWCVSPARHSLLWCRPAGVALDEQRLVERLHRHGWQVQRLAMGNTAQSLEQLRRGYRQVRDLLAYGREVLPQERLLSLSRYRLPALLWRHRNDDALDELLEPQQRIRQGCQRAVACDPARLVCPRRAEPGLRRCPGYPSQQPEVSHGADRRGERGRSVAP